MALRPVREGDPGFIIQQSNKVSSYDREGDGCFTVNVPRSVNEGLAPAADAVRSALGKLAGSVTAPGAAPETRASGVRQVDGRSGAGGDGTPGAILHSDRYEADVHGFVWGHWYPPINAPWQNTASKAKRKKDVAGSAGTDDGNLPPI